MDNEHDSAEQSMSQHVLLPRTQIRPIHAVLRETLNGHGICSLEHCCCVAVDNNPAVE